MFCKYCGKEIDDRAVVCPNCGRATDNYNNSVNVNVNNTIEQKINPGDASSFGFAFLSFLFPLLGIILYAVWHLEFPKKASSCLKGAITGAIVSFVCSFLVGCILGILEAFYEGYYAGILML